MGKTLNEDSPIADAADAGKEKIPGARVEVDGHGEPEEIFPAGMVRRGEPSEPEEENAGQQVDQGAAGNHKQRVVAAFKMNRRNYQRLAAGDNASAAVPQAYVQDVVQHVGENGDGRDRGDVEGRGERIGLGHRSLDSAIR